MSATYLYRHPTLCKCKEPGCGPKHCHSCAPPDCCGWCLTDFISGEEVHEECLWVKAPGDPDELFEDYMHLDICAKCANGGES